MTLQSDISYKELITFLKGLPKEQWQDIKKVVEGQSDIDKEDIEKFLLTAPIFDDLQLTDIEEVRKGLNRWEMS
jgi:hypothetical protein